MPARGYELYLRVFNSISHGWTRVRYRVDHSKIKFVPTRGHVIFCLLYRHRWGNAVMHNNRGSITTVISSHAKDKNWIFTGYQIFVTGKILVFHRCLYNKDYFYQEIVVFSHQSFVACVPIALIIFFSLPLIFILLATSISHFLTAAMTFSCFLFPAKFVSFAFTRSSSFPVIHVSVDIKNNVEKNSALFLLFFSL